MNKHIRQGDILFCRTEDLVTGTSVKKLIVASGEVTFHHHVLIADAGSEIIGDRTKFQVKGSAKLVHPEHDTINFDAGVYVVIPEREYDYVEETLVAVRD